ncbi:MAG: hypothetical protein IJP38_05675 [Oscillospiraceae bacterium]|nr:hypothetical protein [Oscillospiraceae bacterium]
MTEDELKNLLGNDTAAEEETAFHTHIPIIYSLFRMFISILKTAKSQAGILMKI